MPVFAGRVAREIVPRPGVLRLLDELAAAAVPTAIVTASPRRVVDLVRDALGADRFALTLAVEDTVRSKPAPDPYLAAGRGPRRRPARVRGRRGHARRASPRPRPRAARCWPCRRSAPIRPAAGPDGPGLPEAGRPGPARLCHDARGKELTPWTTSAMS